MPTEGVWLALIVAVPAFLAPIIATWITARINREIRDQSWAREDIVAAKAALVAEQAAKAAKLLADAQKAAAAKAAEAAELLLAANERVANTTAVTNGKLDVIHLLVNSNMTAAMQSEHDAVVRELAMMREVIGLKHAAGHEPSIEALAAIEATEAKITELKIVLSERLNAAAKVDG